MALVVAKGKRTREAWDDDAGEIDKYRDSGGMGGAEGCGAQ